MGSVNILLVIQSRMGFCIVCFIKPFAKGYLTFASGNLRTASGTRRLGSRSEVFILLTKIKTLLSTLINMPQFLLKIISLTFCLKLFKECLLILYLGEF